MKKFLLTATVAFALAPFSAFGFELTSPDFADGAAIPEQHALNFFGCSGGNASPALNWTGAPEGTQSFAVFAHDVDLANGVGGFTHWMVIDIPADATGLAGGIGAGSELPAGARQMITDFGQPGWNGPCPPEADGPHRYDFTVYALPVAKMDLPDGAASGFTGFMVNQMAIGKATMIGTYDR